MSRRSSQRFSSNLHKMECRGAAANIVRVLQDAMFDFDIFETIIKYVKDCEELSYKIKKRIRNDDGLQRSLVTYKRGKMRHTVICM